MVERVVANANESLDEVEQDVKWLSELEMQWVIDTLQQGLESEAGHHHAWLAGAERLVADLTKTLNNARADKRRWAKRKSVMGKRSLTSQFQVQAIGI